MPDLTMPDPVTLVAGCVVAWLLGGVPFGLVIVRLVKGVDIRTLGSGNVGATNASRAFGGRSRLPVFFAIYVLDFLKGFVPAWFGPAWLGLDAAGLYVPVLLGAAAVLGHCFSPYLGMRGGKGVATTTGVFAAVAFVPLVIALAVFGVVFALTRRVFFGSIAIGFALAAAVVLVDPATAFGARMPVTVFAVVVASFLLWTHRSNLRAFRAERAAAVGGPK